MKRIIPILSTLLALLICSACTNADEPDTQKADTETKDNYYVRYEASIPSGYSGKVTVNTEIGPQTFSTGRVYTETFGPVTEGFKSSINISCTAEGLIKNSYITVSIYVSKNTEPFVLKASNSGHSSNTKSISTNYRINF